MPRLSVLMPVYNALPYLPIAVESILKQSFTDFEFLILDDASTDGSAEYLDSLKDPRVRVVHLPKAGYAVNLNHGLDLAQGEFIARMDADDESLRDRLALQVAYLEKNPEVVAVGGQLETIDSEGRTKGRLDYTTDPVLLLWQLLYTSPLPHPGTTFRRMNAARVGNYNPSLLPAEDFDLWSRLVLTGGRIANLPETILRYRQHTSNVSVTRNADQRRFTLTIAQRNLAAFLGIEVSPERIPWLCQTLSLRVETPDVAGFQKVWRRFRSKLPREGFSLRPMQDYLRYFALRRGRTQAPAAWLRIALDVDPAWFLPTRLIAQFRRRSGGA